MCIRDRPFPKEERALIESPRDVETYDEKPEMSAYKVLETLTKELESDEGASLSVVNFANPDMVGHTGNYEAALQALEVVDDCLGKLQKICLDNDITLLITADHGNCDEMVHPDGSPHTSHTKAQVPFICMKKNIDKETVNNLSNAALKDIAPTILHLLGVEKNQLISGESIFS